MSARQKVLLLDDDEDLLELYREILGQLPSKPEIHTATSGARAIALLESDAFALLISDLNMPKMDGLQVLTIVRRKFPHLQTAVMTSVVDEQFRARAYSMGIDLFLEKPNSAKEISFFLDCIESLLGREEAAGFRGVQSKSLVDLIQLECLSQSSSVLKVTNGPAEGKIWFHAGEIVDAEVHGLRGEEAFQEILSWKTGNFEILPPEEGRGRAIYASYQGLLLETAQALDEAHAQTSEAEDSKPGAAPVSKLAGLARFNGVEFLLTVGPEPDSGVDSWGVAEPAPLAQWVHATMSQFEALGESLNAGALNQLEAVGSANHLALATRDGRSLCAGFHRSLSEDRVRETMRSILAKWDF